VFDIRLTRPAVDPTLTMACWLGHLETSNGSWLEFYAPKSYWTAEQYEVQWKAALRRLFEGRQKTSCFVTWVEAPGDGAANQGHRPAPRWCDGMGGSANGPGEGSTSGLRAGAGA
jgi:CdiI N-terminal domain